MISKVILTIISIGAIFFLTTLTFFGSNDAKIQEIKFQVEEPGLYNVNINEDGKYYTSIENVNENSFFLHNITFDTRVLSDTLLEKKDNIIKIQNGLYLFQFQGAYKQTLIQGEGFTIESQGPGYIFVNQSDPKNILIFPINTKIHVNLLKKEFNTETKTFYYKDIVTNIVPLYPHNYLRLNPNKNTFLKEESDLLRVSQIHNIGSINEPILLGNTISSNNIDILSLKNEKHKRTIVQFFHYIQQEYVVLKSDFDKNYNFESYLMPGDNYIKKYYDIFLNDQKKKIYYKNLIFKNITELLNTSKPNKNIINIITTTLSDLEQISPNDAKEISEMIHFYFTTITRTNFDNIILEQNFSTLITQIYHIENNVNENAIYLKNSYFYYDFINDKNFLKNINQYASVASKITTNKIDYLLTFLEQILKGNNNDTLSYITIFNTYVTIAIQYYDEASEGILKTGIYQNAEILNNFSNVLKTAFFEEERNKKNLLVKQDIPLINNENYNTLERNITLLLDFFNKNNYLLDTENKNEDKGKFITYVTLTKNFQEYFAAISNYEDYISTYDSIKNDVLNTETINIGDIKSDLLEEDARRYLNSFNGVMGNTYEVYLRKYDYCYDPIAENLRDIDKEENDYCYEVKGFNINQRILNFLLLPYENNKIENITLLEGTFFIEKTGSYKLDIIKMELDEKMNSATDIKEKDRYNFKNYLLYTFASNSTQDGGSELEQGDSTIQEESFIRVFKSTKLFGNEGDFTNIEHFFNVAYNNVTVTESDNGFIAHINGGQIKMNIKDKNKNTTYKLKLFGDYIFSPSHSFQNISVIFMDPLDISGKNKLLYGNSIIFTEVLSINNLENSITQLLDNYEAINIIIQSLQKNLSLHIVSLTYNSAMNQIVFQGNYKNKIIKITLKDGKIIQADYNDITLIQKNTNYRIIDTILTPLK